MASRKQGRQFFRTCPSHAASIVVAGSIVDANFNDDEWNPTPSSSHLNYAGRFARARGDQ